MKLKILRKKTKELEAFAKLEWQNADIEHYGEVKDFAPKDYVVVATEGKTILGKASVHIVAGVAEVKEVIVAKSHRGKGVGTKLMLSIEEIAKKHSAHKLWLNTGKGWESEKFYKDLGYVKTGDLPNHYTNHDAVLYTKEI
jgi:GNAT superfamily N-acetyltransferase